MRLSDFKNEDLANYGHIEIEDMAFFHTMLTRMIEDIEVMVGFLATYKKEESVTENLVREALMSVDPQTTIQLSEASYASVIVRPRTVRDYARAPMHHDEEAIELIAKYVSHRLVRMLLSAAATAKDEGLSIIKLRHYLPLCEEWPWPFNRWC